MLTETSLTNTLTLSGISTIKYRSYTQSYERSELLSFLTGEEHSATKNPNYKQVDIALIEAFRQLIQLNIPSVWQIAQSEENDTLALELWVFWFDDRHTGKIDDNPLLNELTEVKVGSFNWDQLSTSGLSPSASPQPDQKNTGHTTLVPKKEYKLFIKSIRNLIHNSMIAHGTLPLGEFFILPDTFIKDQDIIGTIVDQTTTSGKDTMMACMYNVYLTSSNLVFQPNTRRMRIRPLTTEDMLSSKNKKVILCPTGEQATLLSFDSLPTNELKDQVLDEWAKFYHFDPSQLKMTDKSKHIPSLVTIKTASNAVVTYPTKLVFVTTDTKASPSAVSGLNGIMGLNHGLTEDLGAKVTRSIYQDRLKRADSENKEFIDYWSYRDPIIFSGNTIIDSLSMTDTNYQQDQLLLHRALVEPILSSPIMNAKSVIPLDGTPLLGNTVLYKKYHQHYSPPKNLSNVNMDLVEFTKKNFQIQDDETVESILDGVNPLQDADLQIQNIDAGEGIHAVKVSPPPINATKTTEAAEPEPINDPEQTQPLVDDFSMMYDLNTGGGGDPWDNNEDFGDLDLDVTEADFDFFKTPAPAPILTPNNVLNIMPMDISPVVEKQEDVKENILKSEEELTTLDGQNLLQIEPMETTPNNDSLFTPFVISADSTENVSLNNSFTTTAEPSTAATPVKEERNQPAYISQNTAIFQKSTPEITNFVPQEFLPVPINTTSIDQKYDFGGKFMYDPSSKSSTEQPPKPKSKLKKESYTPNYVPIRKNSKVNKPKVVDHAKVEEILNEDVKMAEVEDISSSSDSDDSKSSSGSSSSGSSSSSYSDSDISNSSKIDSNSEYKEDRAVDKRLRTLKKFQKNVVQCLLKATPAPQPTERQRNIDYDTPFAPILADGNIKPIQWRQSRAMSLSLEYLCQQAIWGGYPFSGGLSDVSENGGEIEGEPDKVLAARRTNMMQITRGVVTHVPSLLTDLQQITKEFKSMLQHIFVQQHGGPGTINSKDGRDETLSIPNSYMDSPSLLGLVDVKGPLNIQQYYNLSESQNTAHSKYGKYQIKKKRPDEPNLDILKQPDIVVSRHEDSLEGSPAMLPFWEKLGLQPYSTHKQVRYMVIYPDNPNVEQSVVQFFKTLSTVYDNCHLGKHDPGHAGQYRNGLVPVPLPDENTSVKQQLKRYEETCEKLGKCLAQSSNEESHHHTVYNVIYMVNPGPHMSSYLDMCRCFYKLKESLDQNPHNKNAQLVLQLVPIEHVLRSSTFGGYVMWGMKDVAFSVYTKCFTIASKKFDSKVTAKLYAPPFVLSNRVPKKIQFKLDDIRPFPIILNQCSTLHVAYCFSYDRAWMSVVWIDSRGELLEYALYPRKTAFNDAWERTMKIAKLTDFPWTIVITKVGLMFNDELLHWLKYVASNKNKYWVSIIGLDLESGLNLHFEECYPEQQTNTKDDQPPTLLDSSGKSVGGFNKQEKHLNNNKNKISTDVAQLLLLSHRISYSQKRERAYKGILRTEAIAEKENWMTPLATGYLIQHSVPHKSVNPCMEQFNNEPFVAEVNLLYNHTQHSAYSSLQDIVKTFYALSFVNPIPSSHNSIPFHVVLAERLSRLLLVIDETLK